MIQDLRFGLRMLRLSPGFACVAILCLTVGIGSTTAVFSWIEGVLLRPYPLVRDADRVLVLSGTFPSASKGTDVSWPDFVDMRTACTLFDAFIAEKIVGTTLSVTGDRAERVRGSVVSANYFDAFGVRPLLGRAFEPAEELGRNAHPVVVISYQLWQTRFGGDPSIVGRTQVLNGVTHTIIGVMPERFYGTFVGYRFAFWVPASMQDVFDPGGYKLEDRGARWIEGFVRLKPGVTIGRAQAEISAVASQLEVRYPATNRARGIKLLPIWRSPFNPMEVLFPTLSVTLIVAAAVLLIACANVANLLLLKSFGRRREITIRLAIGADRARLIRQMLTEGLILSVLAVAGGFLVAQVCRRVLALLFPPRGGVVMQLSADLDWRVLAMSVGICLLATFVFGLAPAVLSSDIALVDALKSESAGVIGGRGGTWVRSSLVILQVSTSFVLLVGAGLMLQSLSRLRQTSPGFSTEGVLTTSIDLVSAGYDSQRARTLEDELLSRLQAVNVKAAAFARTMPFSYRPFSSAPIGVDGFETLPDQAPIVNYDEIDAGYLGTMGIQLLAGREFTLADNETTAPVAIVNETMAARFWRGADPINRRLLVNGRALRVVGVAKASKYGTLMELPEPFFYVPTRQSVPGQALIVRTSLRPETFAKLLARELRRLDPNLAPAEVITTRELVDRTTSPQTMSVTLLSVFSGLALLLAGIGMYGVMAYAVSQSTREFGLRLALGAKASNLVRLVMSQGLTLTACGVIIGAGAAFSLTRLLGNLLYGVSPHDPWTFGAALSVMGGAAVAASAVPAFRATRSDPLLALRS
jgi:macrolide transport system ATP-binding/permease protein